MGISIAISAGESSGDLSGAFLASELRKLRPDLHIWGAGGPKMRDAGVEIAVNMTNGGTIGIAETFKALPTFAARYFQVRFALLNRRPDIFVPIDFGAFNTRLAQVARKHGIPVVYYFPPSSWRKRPKNAPKLIVCGGKVITPFPWSAKLLGDAGVDARFVGHPLIDVVKPSKPREDFIRELDLQTSLPTIGLLPGSRSHEIREHMEPMIEAAEIIHRELGGAQFIIGAAWGSERMRDRIAAASLGKDDFPVIRVVERRTYDCMAASDLLITASGTATLEAALLSVPMVIIYRGSAIMRLEYNLRRSCLEDFIGMPNIIADRGVCPEMLNEDVTSEKVADIALSLLKDKTKLREMKAALDEVRAQLGEPGAIARAANAVLEMGGLA